MFRLTSPKFAPAWTSWNCFDTFEPHVLGRITLLVRHVFQVNPLSTNSIKPLNVEHAFDNLNGILLFFWNPTLRTAFRHLQCVVYSGQIVVIFSGVFSKSLILNIAILFPPPTNKSLSMNVFVVDYRLGFVGTNIPTFRPKIHIWDCSLAKIQRN